jgi:hypothetical protein
MQHHQDWSIQVLSNPVFAQIAPLVTVTVVSAVFFFSFIHLRQLNFDRLIYILNQILVMVLDSLGISLPWLWGGPQKIVIVVVAEQKPPEKVEFWQGRQDAARTDSFAEGVKGIYAWSALSLLRLFEIFQYGFVAKVTKDPDSDMQMIPTTTLDS